MALFKVFKGAESDLNSVPLTEGYAYFCSDTANFFIDVGNNAGDRLQINAYAAQVLKNDTTEIDIDDIFLQSMVATVEQGGTGTDTLTVNALLVGNGTDTVKMISLDEGAIAVGDSTDGVAGLLGTGVLYATTSGSPTFGTAPISAGGTGATTASAARTNLSVYSQTQTDSKVEEATTVAYETTLSASGWVSSGDDTYTYTYSNTSLTCGRDGNVPPLITYTSNLDEYSVIDSAEATVGVGIVFTTSEQPESDIGIIVIDLK